MKKISVLELLKRLLKSIAWKVIYLGLYRNIWAYFSIWGKIICFVFLSSFYFPYINCPGFLHTSNLLSHIICFSTSRSGFSMQGSTENVTSFQPQYQGPHSFHSFRLHVVMTVKFSIIKSSVKSVRFGHYKVLEDMLLKACSGLFQ